MRLLKEVRLEAITTTHPKIVERHDNKNTFEAYITSCSEASCECEWGNVDDDEEELSCLGSDCSLPLMMAAEPKHQRGVYGEDDNEEPDMSACQESRTDEDVQVVISNQQCQNGAICQCTTVDDYEIVEDDLQDKHECANDDIWEHIMHIRDGRWN